MAETSGLYDLKVSGSKENFTLICKMYEYLLDNGYLLYDDGNFDLVYALENADESRTITVEMDSAASVSGVCQDIAPIILALQKEDRTDIIFCIEGDIEEGSNGDSIAYTAFCIDFKAGRATVRKTIYDSPLSSKEDDDFVSDHRDEAYVEGHAKLSKEIPVDFTQYCEEEDMLDDETIDDLCRIIRGEAVGDFDDVDYDEDEYDDEAEYDDEE